MQAPQISQREAGGFVPFAPFWMHALAFIIDALVLVAVFAGPFLVMPDAALALAPGALWWQLAITFLYFTALNGPLGKGATVGKMAVDIRTVRPDGRALTWGEAAGRTLVQLAPFLLVFATTELLATRTGEPVTIATLHARSLLVQTGLALLAALMACLLLSPRLRSYHDRVANTFTGREPIGELFAEAIADADDEKRLLERRALQTGFFVGFVVIGMAGCDMAQNARQYGSDVARHRMEYRAEIEQATTIAGVAPAVWWGAPSPRKEDGVTTLTLGLVYTARGHLPREVVDGLEDQGAARLAELVGADPARLRATVLLAPNPAGEEEPPVELMDWQYRSILAIAREVYPVFGAELPLTTREVGRARIDVRLPPDAMLVVGGEGASAPRTPPAAASAE